MVGKTSIEWTQATWNPLRGCSKISPGCENCYAMHVAARFSGPGQPYERLAKRRPANWTGELLLVEHVLFEPLKRRRPTTYFVNSMSDLFHERLAFEWIDYVIAAMALAPQHTFQVLTKRAERMREYFSDPALGGRIYKLVSRWLDAGQDGPLGRAWERCHDLTSKCTIGSGRYEWTFWNLPLPHVWLGVSMENRKHGLPRMAELRETPALTRFLSIEPLLEDLGRIEFRESEIDWVIVGGESGRNARRCDLAWIGSIVEQCRTAEIPVFVKQLGSNPFLGESEYGVKDVRLGTRDAKGGDWDEWPEALRVRQMPEIYVEAVR